MIIQSKTSRAAILSLPLAVLIILAFGNLALGQMNLEKYRIVISTGGVSKGAPAADVRVRLKGTNGGDSGWIKLDKKGYVDFQAGSTATYDLVLDENLKGDILVAFMVSSRMPTVNEGWFLKSFKLTKTTGNSLISSATLVNMWIYPGNQNRYFDSGLRSNPNDFQPVSSNEIVLVPQMDGSFLIKVNGKTDPRFESNELVFVPQPNGSFLLSLKPKEKAAAEIDAAKQPMPDQKDCSKVSLRRLPNNSIQMINDCTGEKISEVAGWQIERAEADAKTSTAAATANPKVMPGITFENRTDGGVDLYSVDAKGVETFSRRLGVGTRGFVQQAPGIKKWRIKRGSTYLTDYIVNEGPNQRTVIIRDEMTRSVRLETQRQ